MYAEKREENSDISLLSEKNFKNFDFIALYQFIKYFNDKGYLISYSSVNSLSVSSGLIKEIKISEEKKSINIILNFSNFFGYNPLLYDFISEKAIHEKNKSLLIFLNIFYNKIFKLLIEIKKINYPYFSSNINIRILSSISGLKKDCEQIYLPYSSYFSCKYKSKKILEKLLSQFTKMQVNIEEFIDSYLYLEESHQIKLTRKYILDGTSTLGKKYKCNESKIKIIFYPKNNEDWLFFNDKKKSKILINLIDKFINSSFNYSINIFPNKVIQCKLGKANENFLNIKKMGLNSFLCVHERVNKSAIFNFYNG